MNPIGLVEVRVSWPEHPRLLNKKKKEKKKSIRCTYIFSLFHNLGFIDLVEFFFFFGI